MLGSELLSKTAPMYLEECYLYWMAQINALTKMNSVLQDQRNRVQSVLAHNGSFQPEGGGRPAPLSFDKVVEGVQEGQWRRSLKRGMLGLVTVFWPELVSTMRLAIQKTFWFVQRKINTSGKRRNVLEHEHSKTREERVRFSYNTRATRVERVRLGSLSAILWASTGSPKFSLSHIYGTFTTISLYCQFSPSGRSSWHL